MREHGTFLRLCESSWMCTQLLGSCARLAPFFCTRLWAAQLSCERAIRRPSKSAGRRDRSLRRWTVGAAENDLALPFRLFRSGLELVSKGKADVNGRVPRAFACQNQFNGRAPAAIELLTRRTKRDDHRETYMGYNSIRSIQVDRVCSPGAPHATSAGSSSEFRHGASLCLACQNVQTIQWPRCSGHRFVSAEKNPQ